jgi:hypothetical protein
MFYALIVEKRNQFSKVCELIENMSISVENVIHWKKFCQSYENSSTNCSLSFGNRVVVMKCQTRDELLNTFNTLLFNTVFNTVFQSRYIRYLASDQCCAFSCQA